MKDIINDYKSYLKSKQLKIVELDYFSDSDDLNFKYERNINSDNDYSSNFNSESSEESENDNIDSIINKDSNSDDDMMIRITMAIIMATIKRMQLKINYITIYIIKINQILIIIRINKNRTGIKVIFLFLHMNLLELI